MERLSKYYPSITGVVVFVVYLITLSPSVIDGDAGELTAVAHNLGIAHPTGYPLFTILGYLFIQLPLPFSVIYKMNLLSAVWCSLAVTFFIYNAKLIFNNLDAFHPEPKNDKNKSQLIKLSNFTVNASAIFSGLVLAFSITFWLQSTSVEVYALHIFLLNVLLFAFLKAYLNDKHGQKQTFIKYWLLFGILLALGFTNHLSTIFILPGLAYLYFDKFKFQWGSFKRILIIVAVFIPIVVLFYSYLPLRAGQVPALNWGDPSNLEKIKDHILGTYYQSFVFSSGEVIKNQFVTFLDHIFGTEYMEFSLSTLFCIIGICVTLVFNRKIFTFLIVTLITTLVISVNYAIVDIEAYFLLAYIMLAFFAVFGIAYSITLLNNISGKSLYAVFILIVFVIFQFVTNYSKADKSDTYTFEDFTKELIRSTDSNAVIITNGWDQFYFPSLYFQNVEYFRTDAALLCVWLIEPWYDKYMQIKVPEFINRETKNFILQVDERPTYLYSAMISSYQMPKNHYLIPDLFLFKIVNTPQYIPAQDPDFIIRFPSNRNDKNIDLVEQYVGSMLENRAIYEFNFNKPGRANLYLNKIKSDFPNYKLSQNFKNHFGTTE